MTKNELIRFTTGIAVSIVVLFSTWPVFFNLSACKVYAEGPSGYWSLKNTEISEGSSEYGGWGNKETKTEYTVSNGSYCGTYTVLKDYYSASGMLMYGAGFSASWSGTNSSPDSTYYPGDTASITLSGTGKYTYDFKSDFTDPYKKDAHLSAYFKYDDGRYDELVNSNGDKSLSTSMEYPSKTETFSAPIREGRRDGEKMTLSVIFDSSYYTKYVYEWISVPDSAADDKKESTYENTTGNGTDSGGTTVFGNIPKEKKENEVPIAKPQVDNTSASTTYGETSPGNPIGKVIILGGGALVAGAVVSSMKKKNKNKDAAKQSAEQTVREKRQSEEEKEEEDKSVYRMFIKKDFGHYLRRGDKPQTVSARIKRIPENGPEESRPELTRRINIMPGNDKVIVSQAVMNGDFQSATVSLPKDFDNDEAIVSFVFVGPETTYTNHVHFKVFGMPSIVFPEKVKELPFHAIHGLLGVDEVYKVAVILKDFVNDASFVDVHSDAPDIEGYAEKAGEGKEGEYPYWIYVGNGSEKGDKKRRVMISFTASNQNEIATGSFYLYLDPEETEEEDTPVHKEISVFAKDEKGDDGGYDIDPAIIVGTTAVKAYYNPDKKPEDLLKPGKKEYDGAVYKLHIEKSFEEKLHINGKPASIYAWVEKVLNGVSAPVDEFAKAIVATGIEDIDGFANSNAKVVGICTRTVVVNGKTMHPSCAKIHIWVEDAVRELSGYYPNAAFLVRLYGTADSTFNEVISFLVRGTPEIKFILDNKWQKSTYYNATYDMVVTQEKREINFVLENFIKEMKSEKDIKVTFEECFKEDIEQDYGRELKYEIKRGWVNEFHYILEIINPDNSNLSEMMTEYPLIKKVCIKAEQPDEPEETAEGKFLLQIYPEGIFIDSRRLGYIPENGKIIPVCTYWDISDKSFALISTFSGHGDYRNKTFVIDSVRLPVGCAFVNYSNNPTIVFEGIEADKYFIPVHEDSKRITSDLNEMFELKIWGSSSNPYISSKDGFILQPNRTLLMNENDMFLFKMALSYQETGVEGKKYTADFHFRLIGEVPEAGYRAKDREIELIRKFINRYELENTPIMATLLENLPKMSISMLVKYRFLVYDLGYAYENEKYREYSSFASYMDSCVTVCSGISFIVDLSIAFIATISTAGAGYGFIAAPALSALKKICLECFKFDGGFGVVQQKNWKQIRSALDSMATEVTFALIATPASAVMKINNYRKLIITSALALKVGKYTSDNWNKESGAELLATIIGDTLKDLTWQGAKLMILYAFSKIFGGSQDGIEPLVDKAKQMKLCQSLGKKFNTKFISYAKVNIDGKVYDARVFHSDDIPVNERAIQEYCDEVVKYFANLRPLAEGNLSEGFRALDSKLAAISIFEAGAGMALDITKDMIDIPLSDQYVVRMPRIMAAACEAKEACVEVEKVKAQIPEISDYDGRSSLVVPDDVRYFNPEQLSKIMEQLKDEAAAKRYKEMGSNWLDVLKKKKMNYK